jgi:hypothetical protein
VRRVAPAAIAILLAAGLAGCGTKTTPQERAQKALEQQAKEIGSRLEQAGYTVGGLSPGARLDPAPAHSLTTRVDFISPKSFMLTVLVFRTAAQAALLEKGTEEQCAAVPACKATRAARRAKVVGNVLYSGLADDGTTPLARSRVERVVGIAEVPASG